MLVEGTKHAKVGIFLRRNVKKSFNQPSCLSRLATIEGIVFHSLTDASPQFLYKVNPLGRLY